MRTTLERLKAMDDEQLYTHWLSNRFPFEQLPDCQKCLTQHGYYSKRNPCGHDQLVLNVLRADERFQDVSNSSQGITGLIRSHLEELYALRLYFDSLYPQSAEPESLTAAPAEQQVETVLQTVPGPISTLREERKASHVHHERAVTKLVPISSTDASAK